MSDDDKETNKPQPSSEIKKEPLAPAKIEQLAKKAGSQPEQNKTAGTEQADSEPARSESARSEPARSEPADSKPASSESEKSKSDPKQTSQPPSANPSAKPSSSSASAAELFNAKAMPKMSSKKTKNTWLAPVLISLLVLLALLASGWTLYQQHLFNQNWANLQTDVKNQISQQSATIEQAKRSADASVQAANQSQLQLSQLATKNQQLTDSLFSTQEKIKAFSGRQKQDWMLAEAAYLIKLAQLQLTLQKDKLTAIQLLKTADSRIIEIADNSLLPIREGIAQDLSDLNLILQPDTTGMSLALDAISHQIASLELLALEFQPLEQSIPDPEVTEEGFDLEKIYQDFLRDFVTVRDHSEPVKPLMTPEQRGNLNSNVQLAIQQAQIALLQGNERLYRLNIDNATHWIDQFFKHDDKATQVTAQLKQLKTKPVEVHYPNKLNAKTALDHVSQQQLYRWLESSLSNQAIDSHEFIESNPIEVDTNKKKALESSSNKEGMIEDSSIENNSSDKQPVENGEENNP